MAFFIMCRKKINNSKNNWLSPFFRTYIARIIAKTREIRCEKCGVYEGLEFHHTKYENVSINDIRIRCNKCHRNCAKPFSLLKTVFEEGKRFCIVSGYKFEY